MLNCKYSNVFVKTDCEENCCEAVIENICNPVSSSCQSYNKLSDSGKTRGFLGYWVKETDTALRNKRRTKATDISYMPQVISES
jgi:hypothetical protein